MLVANRAVQSVAAALIAPQIMSLIVHLFPAEGRGRALDAFGAVSGAALAAGLLATWTCRRGIFLLNLPVGVVGWIAAARLRPDWTARPEAPAGPVGRRAQRPGPDRVGLRRAERRGVRPGQRDPAGHDPFDPRLRTMGVAYAATSCP
ncbi:MFS transporter [Streptomyces sp. NPDC006487]|uniref:MFS transporter n=1 Tax=Streptomyces sp. NPDC006487 TaxID=3364748 RepID=UPI00369E4449